MMKARIIKDKKGVSPLFISLYLALLAVLLISTLFVALGIQRSALTERLRIEQDRMQESLVLAGPDALKLIGGSIVQALRINNTGSITVRIRALYIDQKFICDPSKFENDSYIEPAESLWIQLYPNVNPPIVLNDTALNAYWTVTTERGTRASETGGNLIWESPWIPYSPKKFYFGPLMLVFDMFHWSSGTGPWMNGWTIPKGTEDVTWRILLVNVDDRDIVVNDTSCFTLICNGKSPSDPLPWYINGRLGQTTFKPGIFNFVYYSLHDPSDYAHGRGITGVGDPPTTFINFLTFTGYFVEANGTRTPFGQTIPFEAVLVVTETMPAKLTLTSNPENIKNDGSSTSTITATVTDSSGNPVANAWVDFYTTAGALSTTHANTTTSGIATVNLTSTTSKTTAYVNALCQNVQGSCKVTFTPAFGIRVTAQPNVISRNNGTSTITVQLVDASNNDVAQSGITITVRISSWTGNPPSQPTLTNATYTGSSVIVTTDSSGSSIITLTAQGRTGTATITALASGLSSDSTTIQVQ